MTSDLQQTRYDQIIRRVGGIIGPGSKVSEALTELFPTIDVENIPAELLILGGWRMAMGAVRISAVPAEVPKAQLFNPTGSGLIIVVERINATGSSTQSIRMAVTATPLDVDGGNEQFRDTRAGVANVPVGSVRFESTAGNVSNIWEQTELGNTPVILESSQKGILVLAPGTGVNLGPAETNVLFACGFLWRERVALESELIITIPPGG